MWRNLPIVQYYPENHQASENWSSWFEHCGFLIGQIPGKSRKWLFCSYLSSLCGQFACRRNIITRCVNMAHNTHKQAKPWPQAKHYKRNKANLSDPIKTFMRAFNTVGTALITENVHVTQQHDQHGAHRVDRLAWNLLSGGTLSLCGHPERLRWWGYRPVTWPVPSQPGVGHRLSFLSTREASVNWKSCWGD